jgi:hypothetical protein
MSFCEVKTKGYKNKFGGFEYCSYLCLMDKICTKNISYLEGEPTDSFFFRYQMVPRQCLYGIKLD